MSKLCIGLFGTCGKSTWRKPFIREYQNRGMVEGINFFNPQVENWDPSCAEIETEHLAEDSIILFPVTSETYAFGSLSEVGFSILSAIKLDDRRDIVILIDQHLDPELMKDESQAKDSLRSRALVKQHLKKLRHNNLYVVNTLEEMFDLSLILYQSQELLVNYQKQFNPKNK